MSSLIAHITLQDLKSTYTPPSEISPQHAYKSAAPAPLPIQPHAATPGVQARQSGQVGQASEIGETPVLRASVDARGKGYDGIAIPLTNEKWKERWCGMCLLPTGDAPDKQTAETKAEAWRAKPGFLREEVTITRLGEFQTYSYVVFSIYRT